MDYNQNSVIRPFSFLGYTRLAQAWVLRPLACGALGLAIGLALGRHQAGGLFVPALVAATLAALGAGFLALWQGRHAALAGALVLAGISGGLHRVQALAIALEAPAWGEKDAIGLQGTIASDDGPRTMNRRHLYVLSSVKVQDLRAPAAPWQAWPGRVRASVELEQSDALGLLPGDTLQAYGKLSDTERVSNPGEFDYRSYLLGKGINASFSARQGWPCSRLKTGEWYLPRRLAARAQTWMAAGLSCGLDGRWLILGRGIVLGDKSGLTREDLAAYSRSGLADLLAVSGTHFTIALGLFLFLARLLTHSKRKQAAAGLVLGLSYALITGFEAPVQRAFALFALWLMGRLFDLDTELPSSLAAGALVILWIQPGALWEPGFQLSFVTTLAVVTLGPCFAKALPKAWPHWLRVGSGALLGAQWGLLPLLAYHFHQCCWPALFAALVSGGFTFLILALGLPLALLGTWIPGVGIILGWPLAWVLRALDTVSNFSAHLPGSAYSTGSINLVLLFAFVLWALAALFSRGSYKRWILGILAPVFLLALLWQGLPFRHRHPGVTRVWCFDVGQGDSTLLEFGDGRTLLVDGGAAKPDAGAWVVLPALRALGIQRLHWAVATHADADHVGGLTWILQQFPVRELLWNGQASTSTSWQAIEAQARLSQVPLRVVGTDVPRQPNDGPWEIIAPSPKRFSLRSTKSKTKKAKKPDTNGASIVLRIEDWLMLTGDFPKKGESQLIKHGLQPVQVLKVGHHGSRTSTSPAFVQALAPHWALISCGRKNTYGHPNAEALQALSRVPLLRTDLEGCLILEHKMTGDLKIATWWPANPAKMRQARSRPISAWKELGAFKPAVWDE